jgi:hypothetical protein
MDVVMQAPTAAVSGGFPVITRFGGDWLMKG